MSINDSGNPFDFTGFGGNQSERLENPGWHVGVVEEVQTHDRKTGHRLANKNNKPFVRFILRVTGGPDDSKTLVDNVYNSAGFRLRQYCNAVGYEISPHEDKASFNPDHLIERPLVFHATFRTGSDRLNVELPEGERGPAVISIDQAKELASNGTIEVSNLDAVSTDSDF